MKSRVTGGNRCRFLSSSYDTVICIFPLLDLDLPTGDVSVVQVGLPRVGLDVEEVFNRRECRSCGPFLVILKQRQQNKKV